VRSLREIYAILRGIHKTIYFNFHYLPFGQAIRLPILVSHRVWLKKAGGKVILNGPIRPGIVAIGFGDVGIFDKIKSRSVWEVYGSVVFEGLARFGHGSKIVVYGQLEIGDWFNISAESSIICRKHIRFGKQCLLSWDVLIMDTDFHPIKDSGGVILNPNKEIIIGDYVWICCRSTILKGSVIGNMSVVAAGSFVNKPLVEQNSLIGGHPAKVLRKGISWEQSEDGLSLS
jgi:acetyltransferase-like isoleucine patch superfamily enzyme